MNFYQANKRVLFFVSLILGSNLFFMVHAIGNHISSLTKTLEVMLLEKETCNTDETKDYWLLDFTVYPNSPKVGDTLILNGITYTNVLKLKGLDPRLKQIGMRVSIDYKIISGNSVTTGCTVATPVTYPLKEIFIINQGEIR